MKFYHNNKIETYNYLMDNYIEVILKLIDFSNSLKILPFKMMFGLNYIKKTISENRVDMLEHGIQYLLTHKDIILNFDLNKLDNLDEDSDDNMSIKSCVNNIKKKQNLKQNMENLQNNIGENEILDLIIEIKNNSKKTHPDDIILIKMYFELLISILEKIQNLFI